MKSSTKKFARILLIACAALCAALIVAQLIPYWSYQNSETGTSDSISVLEYLMLPSSHLDVTKLLGADDAAVMNSLAGTFCIVLLLGAVAITFIAVKPNSCWIALWPLSVGFGSLIGYLTNPLWQLGSIYIVFVILSALLSVCALIPAVIWANSLKYWFMDPKDLPSAK